MPRKLPDTGYPLELIEWVDHSGRNAHGWFDVEMMQHDDDYTCVSVGWVIYESRKRIVLVPHLGNEAQSGTGEMNIIKSAITRRHRISHEKSS